jgi:hypothetical protein
MRQWAGLEAWFFSNFVSKPAKTIQPNWACLFFLLQKCRWV